MDRIGAEGIVGCIERCITANRNGINLASGVNVSPVPVLVMTQHVSIECQSLESGIHWPPVRSDGTEAINDFRRAATPQIGLQRA